MWSLFINIVKVNILSSPFKIMDEFTWTVTFLQNESVLEKLTKLFDYIHIWVISNSARKFPQFSFLSNLIFANWIQSTSDTFKVEEIKFCWIRFQELDIFLHFVEIINDACDFIYDILLFLLAIFEISQSLLFEVTC